MISARTTGVCGASGARDAPEARVRVRVRVRVRAARRGLALATAPTRRGYDHRSARCCRRVASRLCTYVLLLAL